MVHGTYSVKRVITQSICILAEDARLERFKSYKIYAPALMPFVEHGNPKITQEDIDTTIIKSDTKMSQTIKTQNYITAIYMGTDPPTREKWDYRKNSKYKTKKGTKFILTCSNGNPHDRTFDEIRTGGE